MRRLFRRLVLCLRITNLDSAIADLDSRMDEAMRELPRRRAAYQRQRDAYLNQWSQQ